MVNRRYRIHVQFLIDARDGVKAIEKIQDLLMDFKIRWDDITYSKLEEDYD